MAEIWPVYFFSQKPINMSPFFKRVLWTGLIAGFLDILSAYIHVFVKTHQISRKMFNYIAAGAIGLKNSMSGGAGAIALGVFIHFFIAFLFTLFFFLIYRKARLFTVNKYVMALVYGVFTWFVMNVIVLPLSQLPHRPFDAGSAALEAGILVVTIGLPLSLSARAFFSGTRVGA